MILPTIGQLRLAVECYLREAYSDQVPPPQAQRLLPGPQVDTAQWLMDEAVEREPHDAPLEEVRSFTLRAGNARYPHMKLRLTRPTGREFFVFTVDVHDAILHAPPGSLEQARLEELKEFNAQTARRIVARWDSEGILTEHAYMRREIRRARQT